MKLLYDMHSHILPAMDDGAKNIDESLILINRLKRCGITDICLTPHFYTHRESLETFLDRRDSAYRLLSDYADGSVRFHLGAEVYVTKYLFSNELNLHLACYNGLSYMLTEFPYSSTFEGESMLHINRLINNYGITPVIAHVERYPYLLKHPRVADELLSMGVVFQSNACSFLKFPLKHKLIRMLEEEQIQIIGSDAHSLSRNTPDAFDPLDKLIEKKLSTAAFSGVNEACSKILS